jgi:hypothetical protein
MGHPIGRRVVVAWRSLNRHKGELRLIRKFSYTKSRADATNKVVRGNMIVFHFSEVTLDHP